MAWQKIIIFLSLVCMMPALFKIAYTLMLSIFARRPHSSGAAPKSLHSSVSLEPKSFYFLIPAHNEATVIGPCVDSIFAMDYPRERIQVTVIADNCKDDTAGIAESFGATSLRRFTKEISGKAKALEYGFEKLHEQSADYDYLVVVDADNILAANWAANVILNLANNPDGFQTSVETKNPDDDAVTFGNYLSFVIMNRVVQQGRHRLGLPAMLAGTGMGFSHSFLSSGKFKSQSLTEDKDLSFRALVEKYDFRWIGSAEIYDEKPLGAKASFKQYKRWSSGLLSDAQKLRPALVKVLNEGRFLTAIDIIFANLGPWLLASYVSLAFLSLVGAVTGTLFPVALFAGIIGVSFGLLALIVSLYGNGWADVRRLWTYAYVRVIGWASLAMALVRPDTEWTKTVHGRPMGPHTGQKNMKDSEHSTDVRD
jgi:cellulose synthase/poly-beta-1,6-N-acetylglucosamine synthase-like glycosyltransferase